MGVLRYLSDGGRKSAPHGLLLVVTVVCYYNPCCYRRQRAFPLSLPCQPYANAWKPCPTAMCAASPRVWAYAGAANTVRQTGSRGFCRLGWLPQARHRSSLASRLPRGRLRSAWPRAVSSRPSSSSPSTAPSAGRAPLNAGCRRPGEAPQTISEELYYCGLLAATPPALLEKAVRLTLPADLQFLFTADALLGVFPPLPMTLAIRPRLCCMTSRRRCVS